MYDESKIEMKISEETKELHELCEKLEKLACHSFENGMDKVNTEEAGQVIDMIKDLCEAKEKVVKSCYYKTIIKAMEKEEEENKKEEEMYGRMGYRGRDSMGRFVHRSGRGRSAGYTPLWHMMPEMDDMYDEEYPEMYGNYRMGYTGGRTHDMNMGGDSMRGTGESSRYGRSYDNYKSAKRHYTETKSPEHQKAMRDSIAEVFDDMEEITVDMVKDMTPEEKQRYKVKLQQMMQKIQ